MVGSVVVDLGTSLLTRDTPLWLHTAVLISNHVPPPPPKHDVHPKVKEINEGHAWVWKLAFIVVILRSRQ